MMSYQHLNQCDRKVIKKMLTEGKSVREIARYTNRSPSSISREMARNSEKYWYHPIIAHEKYLARKRNAVPRKIDKNETLRTHIIQELKNKNSPDCISGRLKLSHKNNPDMRISPEAIYCWIYAQAGKGYEWYRYLARGVKKRHKRLNKKKPRIQIPDRKSIHTRPQSVETRQRKGHWEGDTIVGKGHQRYIATIVERKTYFLAAGLMIDKRPTSCNRAILEAFGNIPNDQIKSITVDNGSEFYLHKDLQEALQCPIYFADPYSSWQRGINEHTNGMLRRYFPKSMDFKELTQNDVDEAVFLYNNRPRKSLGYRTPYECFYGLSVALQG